MAVMAQLRAESAIYQPRASASARVALGNGPSPQAGALNGRGSCSIQAWRSSTNRRRCLVLEKRCSRFLAIDRTINRDLPCTSFRVHIVFRRSVPRAPLRLPWAGLLTPPWGELPIQPKPAILTHHFRAFVLP